MRAQRISGAITALADPASPQWQGIERETVALVATPLALVRETSPFLALSDDHGRVQRLEARAAHDGTAIALHLSWDAAEPSTAVRDLDQFVDGIAAMFPLAAGAPAISMGAPGKPVNAWHWKAGAPAPYDVLATGYGTTRRERTAAHALHAQVLHADGKWQVVFWRALDAGADRVRFRPGASTGIAFAVWSGANRERSGRKSFSGEFAPLEIGR